MDLTTRNLFLTSSPLQGDPVYVDDVFSTYLYNGIQYTQQLINGIDLAGDGGLVWIKNRDNGRVHSLYDSERNLNKRLRLPYIDAEQTMGTSGTLTFNSNGFTVPAGDGDLNQNGFGRYVSWSFRKARGFFDVVTYTGNGVNGRQIPHALGSTPGMVIVKRMNGSDNWTVQHRSLGGTKSLYLNLNSPEDVSATEWNNTAATSTAFTVGTSGKTNANGDTYVAYIFAHDDAQFGTDGDEAIVKCGSFTTNGSGQASVDLGFEPQWLIYKRSNGGSESWQILDVMRGWTVNTSGAIELFANSTSSEAANNGNKPSSSGFILDAGHSWNATYVYMAIRRPNKPPEAGTDVFETITYQGNGNLTTRSTSITVDLIFSLILTSSRDNYVMDRLRGPKRSLRLTDSSNEDNRSDGLLEMGNNYLYMDDYENINQQNYSYPRQYVLSMFKRAPGFFDMFAYQGNGSSQNLAHNLTVPPELLIIRQRDGSSSWGVYSNFTNSNHSRTVLQSSTHSTQSYGSSNYFLSAPTATTIQLGNEWEVNRNQKNYIGYSFATLPGISKVGTYTGSYSDVNVDCGFTSGARYVLIKRLDGSGDWYNWDTVRGITSGNDPYLLINTTSNSFTNHDYIDPLSSGFTVTSSAPAQLNQTGDTYLFLAIA